MNKLWQQCTDRLESDLTEQEINTWIRPLQAVQGNGELLLLAPNRFVMDWVKDNFIHKINGLISEITGDPGYGVHIDIGADSMPVAENEITQQAVPKQKSRFSIENPRPAPASARFTNNLNSSFTFDNFVQGKSNQLARAAALQISQQPGKAYNPLFIYGGVGLGKTHLMHAIGNEILALNHNARVVYLHSERFVDDMVKALQTNMIDEFKRHYRSLNALLIDDIQFFAGKDRSQEEFFHTFNALLEDQQQVIMASDRYPKEVEGLEERLKSRFGWGLTVAIEPPELETRVAILNNKAEQSGFDLPQEVSFFIAKRVRSNIRELEGVLRRVIAGAQFTGSAITIDFVRDSLHDLLALQEKLVTVDNIKKTVAEYFRLSVGDLESAKRSRSIARPRQIAMALAKELTSHSLPEIGDKFGGRDHTTVLHACKKVAELKKGDRRIEEDYNNLLRTLSH